MFSKLWDIRLEISEVSACEYLNKMSVHVNNRKIQTHLLHCFGLNELNKTMGIMCDRNSSKT